MPFVKNGPPMSPEMRAYVATGPIADGSESANFIAGRAMAAANKARDDGDHCKAHYCDGLADGLLMALGEPIDIPWDDETN